MSNSPKGGRETQGGSQSSLWDFFICRTAHSSHVQEFREKEGSQVAAESIIPKKPILSHIYLPGVDIFQFLMDAKPSSANFFPYPSRNQKIITS